MKLLFAPSVDPVVWSINALCVGRLISETFGPCAYFFL